MIPILITITYVDCKTQTKKPFKLDITNINTSADVAVCNTAHNTLLI